MSAPGLIPERHYLLVDDNIDFAENLAEILRLLLALEKVYESRTA
jgi:hypothetical protein